MRNELLEVDGLILEVADYKNNYAEVAAEKLLRRCSTSWPWIVSHGPGYAVMRAAGNLACDAPSSLLERRRPSGQVVN
jgi:hypothetical protein